MLIALSLPGYTPELVSWWQHCGGQAPPTDVGRSYGLALRAAVGVIQTAAELVPRVDRVGCLGHQSRWKGAVGLCLWFEYRLGKSNTQGSQQQCCSQEQGVGVGVPDGNSTYLYSSGRGTPGLRES